MEIRIGVQHVGREVVIDSEQSADEVRSLVDAAVADGTPLVLTDAKGRHIAAVNVSMRVGTENARADKIKEKILPRLRETALRIGHAYRSGAGLSLPS